MNTEKTLINLIKSHIEDTGEISSHSNICDIGYDSLKFIELVIKIEHEFEIEFNDEDLYYRKFTSVKEIEDYIERKIGGFMKDTEQGLVNVDL